MHHLLNCIMYFSNLHTSVQTHRIVHRFKSLDVDWLFVIPNVESDTNTLIHRFAHQPVHNELAELATIVTVDGVCHADNHFKIVHIYVPIRVIREQTERAVSILRMNRLPFESVWMCSGRSPVRST